MPLTALLKDPDAKVRQAVIRALGELGDARAVEPLIGKLNDPDAKIQQAVITALGELGFARAVEPLIGKLNDPVAKVRQAAIVALRKSRDPRVSSALPRLLHDPDPESRAETVGALAQRYNKTNQRLLSRDLDGSFPWIDPQQVITEQRVRHAAQRLRVTYGEVRSHYETLATELHLVLAWKEKPAES